LQVIEMIRHCPDCGQDMLFEQHHAEPGRCPDSPDGCCQEWLCTACGAALIVGYTPAEHAWADVVDLRGRVA
jgi:hypothetical protein